MTLTSKFWLGVEKLNSSSEILFKEEFVGKIEKKHYKYSYGISFS